MPDNMNYLDKMVIINIFVVTVLAILIIISQIILSKRENKKLGFILPIFTFSFSILIIMYLFLSNIKNQFPLGEFIKDTFKPFIMINIVTVILLIIHFTLQKKNKHKQLEKMSIKDL